SDPGSQGTSHEATHNDGFGYVTELSNCNCGRISQADCTGATSDPICDVKGNMAPRCSDDLNGSQTCDARGDVDGVPENSDCFVCNDESINAGAWCGTASGTTNESACQSRCYDDATGLPVVPQDACLLKADCAAGQSCRGRCNNT